MKTINYFIMSLATISLLACSQDDAKNNGPAATENATVTPSAGQSAVADNESAKNIVQVASGSKDHTTLVTAVKTAELVDVLSNAGPFTVFAPTNAAFDALPAGTVEGLLVPEKKEALQDILQYHVFVGVLQADALQDGQKLGMVNGGSITISQKDGKTMINGTASITASIPTSNGVIHVIDKVLLPK
jgi:uncharacterized surface protein with fasciclin (FAS1) repeats